MFYSNQTPRDFDSEDPQFQAKLNAFYQQKLESILYVVDQSAEMIEGNLDLHAFTNSNAAIGLRMLQMLGMQIEELLS